MEIFRVPSRRVHARVVLDDGRVLDAEVFTAVTGPDGRPQRVVDRLNDREEEFIPVALDGDRLLLNKAGIVSVRMERGDGAEVEGPGEGPAREVPVRVGLAGGESLVGKFRIIMPPERSRVLDYLNAAPRFLPLADERHVTLIQKRYIVSVRGSND